MVQQQPSKKTKHSISLPPDTGVFSGWWVALGLGLLAVVIGWWIGLATLRNAWTVMAHYLGMASDTSLVVSAGETVQPSVVPAELPRRLDGVTVTRDQTNRLPYAVMVENLPVVRPQSGLSSASVVYETLAEGGSTRFMLVFDPSVAVPEIMPVRSARPYYLEWASEYGAMYCHAGGSPKALTVIRENPDIPDCEALGREARYFWRATHVGAPHNLVTSSEKMTFALRDKGLDQQLATFQAWRFKDEALVEERGDDAKTLSFNFSSGTSFAVSYAYRQTSNTYARFNSGAVHTDKNTGEQLQVNNVIVQLVDEPELAGEKGRLDIYVGGTGKAWIFRDGHVIEGTWRKASRTDRTIYYDSIGKEVELNRGNTWVHVLPKDQSVDYQ